MSSDDDWIVHSRKNVIDFGTFLKVEAHDVEIPGGPRIPDWPFVITPDYINVVATTREGLFICFRQTKYAIDGTSLSIVGGYIESGENPLAAAQREMLEETGYQSDAWTSLGQYVVDANRGCGKANLFLAQNAEPVAEPDADDLEAQELVLLTRSEIDAALKRGDFKVLAWATAVVMALQRL